MKKLMKRIGAVLMAVAMMAALGITGAFAQDKTYAGTDAGTASITVKNPATGETYSIYKLFDATVSSNGSKIAYKSQDDIPTQLTAFFSKDAKNNVIPDASIVETTDATTGIVTATKMTDELKAALEAWAKTQTATASVVSDGSQLVFKNLPYGYYVMTTTHIDDTAGKALITVCSTKPNAEIRDKNANLPSANKDVTPAHVSVGDTVTYTAEFNAPNYMESKTAGADPEQVVSYIIKDTLPSFLGDVTVTEVKIVHTPAQAAVADDPTTTENETQAAVPEVATTLNATNYQFTNKQIEIPWVAETVPTTDHKYTSLYKSGSTIVITYTAKVTAEADVGAGNVNKVSIMPQVDSGTGKKPWDDKEHWEDEATIYTHAAALQKKANSTTGDNLAGAEFSFKGLTVTGVPGFYTVVSYDKSASARDGTIMKCDANGKLIIAGIDADSTTPIKLIGKETKAPEGFNEITGTFELTTTVMDATTTTEHADRHTWYDADGNIVDQQVTGGTDIQRKEITQITDLPATSIMPVVNKEGAELPSTGGIGTYVFTIAGVAIMAIAAGLLIVRHKKKAE